MTTKSSKTKLNTQYSLDRKNAKISALSSGNVNKYEFLTGEDLLPEKDLLKKVAAIKRFEYSPLGKELKNQTSVAKNQYQKFESNKNEERTRSKRSRAKSNLVYNKDFTFYKYRDIKDFAAKRSPD